MTRTKHITLTAAESAAIADGIDSGAVRPQDEYIVHEWADAERERDDQLFYRELHGTYDAIQRWYGKVEENERQLHEAVKQFQIAIAK